jgi:hypothetical protein
MRKTIFVVLAAATFSLIPAGAAFAGFDDASANTECAGHGAFGALGEKGIVHDIGINNPSGNERPGASNWKYPRTSDGATTAGTNSSLCGNGAEPPPFTP